MTRVQKVWDSPDGSATPGRVFTASIAQEAIPNVGQTLDYLKVGVKGAVSTAAVVIETFAGLINPFTLRYGAENRIVLTLQEMCALMSFYYHQFPAIGENTDNTGNDFIGGLKVPVYEKADPAKQFLLQADRAAVTNIGTETLAVSAYWDTNEQNRKPIQAVRVPHTTAGTAGIEVFGSKIPPTGKLIGVILGEPNGFGDGNIDTSVQKFKIYSDSQVVAEFNDLADHTPTEVLDYVTPAPLADLLRPYSFYDLRPAGLDAKATALTIAVDVQDVSDNIVVIPVMEIE